MAGAITVKPGETLTVVGVPADSPLPPYIPGPVDPGYSPPWAQILPVAKAVARSIRVIHRRGRIPRRQRPGWPVRTWLGWEFAWRRRFPWVRVAR